MKVKELMQTRVFTVGPDDMVDRVFFLLHYEKIRHLPVVDRNRVVGIVSDRDLYKVLGPRGRHRMVVQDKDKSLLYVIPRKVRHIMRRGVITASPEDSVSTAAQVMARKKIGALPIVRNGKLAGIVTATDVLKAFARISSKLDKILATRAR